MGSKKFTKMKNLLEQLSVEELMEVKGGHEEGEIIIVCEKVSAVTCNGASAVGSSPKEKEVQ